MKSAFLLRFGEARLFQGGRFGRLAALAMLCGTSVHATAALTVSCPLNWDDLTGLGSQDLDHVVYGVKVRDWQPEYLDEWIAKGSECVRQSKTVSSIKSAQYDELRRMAGLAKVQYFPNIERRRRSEGVSAAASDLGLRQLSQVSFRDGQPESVCIQYGGSAGRSYPRTCERLRGGIGLATLESFRQAAVFAKWCQQIGKAGPDLAATLERQANGLREVAQQTGAFASAVDQAAAKPFNAQAVAVLKAQDERFQAQSRAVLGPDGAAWSDDNLDRARPKLAKLTEQGTALACDAGYAKAGFPAKWKRNYVLLGPNEPAEFSKLICDAVGGGAQVRYLSGGMFAKEGFEVRSPARTVQLFVEAKPLPGGDPAVQLMVPVQAQVFGKKVDVTRANLMDVVVELMTASANR